MPPPDPLLAKLKAALGPGGPSAPPSNDDVSVASILNQLAFGRSAEMARKGDLGPAADLLVEAVNGERPSAESLDLLARIRVQQGRPMEAAELWRRLLGAFPTHEGARAALERLSRQRGQVRGFYPPASTILGVLAFLSLAALGFWILVRTSQARRQVSANIAHSREDGRQTAAELKGLIDTSAHENAKKLESLRDTIADLRKDSSRSWEERLNRDNEQGASLKAIQDALGRVRLETESIRKRVETPPPASVTVPPPARREASAPLIVERCEFPKAVLYSAEDSISVGFDHPWSDPANPSLDGMVSTVLIALAKSVPPSCPSIEVLLICPSDESPDQVLRRAEALLKELAALTGLSPKKFSLSLKPSPEPGYGPHPLLIRVLRATR